MLWYCRGLCLGSVFDTSSRLNFGIIEFGSRRDLLKADLT